MRNKLKVNEYKRAFRNFKGIFSFLNLKVRILTFLLIISLIFTSITELIGLASLIPLLNSLSDKESLNEGLLGKYLTLFQNFGINSEIILVINCLFLILISYIARISANYYTLKVSNLIGFYLYNKALKSFLKLSYSDQTIELSNRLAHCLSIQIHQVVTGYIFPLLSIFSSIFVVLALGGGLFFFSPLISILLTLLASLFYINVGFIFMGSLSRYGEKYTKDSGDHLLLISGIKSFKKQIKLYSLEEFLYKKLSNFQNNIRKFNVFKNFVGTLTKPLLELLVLICFAIFIFYLSFQTNGYLKLTELIFVIVVSQKLFPVFQAIYQANNNIIANSFLVEEFLGYCYAKRSHVDKKMKITYNLLKKISLKNVDFRYQNNPEKSIFDSINYEFKFGESYCIKAPSGFGKSTLVDLLLGLLRPNNGTITYEGDNVSYSAGDFLAVDFISYVPQSNFFLDGDLRFILTYNYGASKISDKKIMESCKIACVDNVIINLDKKLSTKCSNNLSEFSGGQKQRLAIAQALLNNNIRILILDETLSNLDKQLAKKILKNIKNKFPDLTIMLITHDESIVPTYFKIVNIEKIFKKKIFQKK